MNTLGAGGSPMPRSKISVRNVEGYMDRTAADAMNSVLKSQNCFDDADARNNKLIKALKLLIDLAGFDLVDRIVVKDRLTGRTYH